MKYVADNPRRYIYKKRYPDLFRRYLHLTLVNHEFAAFGNIFLLKEMYLLQQTAAPAGSVARKREPQIHCRLHRIPPHERPGPRHSLPLLIRPRLPEPEIEIDFSA